MLFQKYDNAHRVFEDLLLDIVVLVKSIMIREWEVMSGQDRILTDHQMCQPMYSSQRSRSKRRNYDSAAVDLLRMIDIALESCDHIGPHCYEGYPEVRRGEIFDLRRRIIDAPDEERNLRALNAVQRELLQHYNYMCLGSDTKFFWSMVEAEGLAERRDYVARALARGRILTDNECYCVEGLYKEQWKDGRITEVQMRKVQRMIHAFTS